MIDYTVGDMVAAIPPPPGMKTHPDTPTRPVMVASFGEIPFGMVCLLQMSCEGCCGLAKSVRFVDWRDPNGGDSVWIACRFRKVPTQEREVERDEFQEIKVPELIG